MKKYPDRDPNDSLYVEYDEETGCWGVFGSESGHCYDLVCSKSEAEEALTRRIGT